MLAIKYRKKQLKHRAFQRILDMFIWVTLLLTLVIAQPLPECNPKDVTNDRMPVDISNGIPLQIEACLSDREWQILVNQKPKCSTTLDTSQAET